MGVRQGVMFSLSPTAASSSPPSSVIFVYACSTSLFFCFFPRQPLRFKGVPSLPPAALPPPLSNSSPSLLSLPLSLTLPFCSPLRRAGGCHIARPWTHRQHRSNKGVGAATPKGACNVGLGDGQRGWQCAATCATLTPNPRLSTSRPLVLGGVGGESYQ